ncbi:enoyl-CoA hydratase-related protein [Sulfitobacter sp. F26169L]|uniref:enoyl-CoA hydratase-related protein n=1 Tax=Sulfitobacter sp. F26169L TaxID=2996015 RepID=UPI002260C304|nr:enoyl-CoA hydratase-related protein [Sulfitobacter sp. F26169L]MCX7567931.1 enoyl-CoA hydratase-related protein [Sulfitobacter sp. F26169L]
MTDTQSADSDDLDKFWSKKFEYTSVTRDGHVLEVTIDRADRYNALHGPAHHELQEIFNAYDRDRNLWVAILTGAGDKAFCSGNDLKATSEGHDIQPGESGFGGICNRWGREKPIIAAVNGVAMGGGCEIVLASDIAVADAGAKFALPEVKVGLFAAAGGVQRLTRQIGRKAAMELILTGRAIDAERACALGIINRVAPDGESAMDIARAIAKEITMASPTAVRASKRVLNILEEDIERLPEAFKASGPEFQTVLTSNDGKEGVQAFVEKRSPNWTNS